MAKDIIIKAKVVLDEGSKNGIKDIKNDLEKNPVEIPVKVSTEGSIQQLRELKKELRNAAAGSEEFNKLYNQIDDLEEKIKGTKKASSDWVDQLAAAPGPLGSVGKAINAVKEGTVSFSAALKATGIGLIVALLGSLYGAFNDNDKAMKKIQPLLIGIQKIFGGIFAAVEPLFNILVDLAIKALPLVSKGFEVVYSSISAVLQSLGSLGSAISKLLKGDFTGAWDAAKQSVTSFGKNYDETAKNFQAGTQEMTKTEKEEADKRAKLLEEQQKKRDEIRLKEKAAQEKAAAEEKARKEKAFADEQTRLNNLAILTETETTKAQQRLEDLEDDTSQKRLDRQIQRGQDEIDVLKQKGVDVTQIQQAFDEENKIRQEKVNQELNAINQKATDDAIKKADDAKKAEEELEAKKTAIREKGLQQGAATLQQASELLGKGTAAGKAAAVASATINTYQAATAAYASLAGIPIVGPALGAVAAGVAIAAGLANVKAILAVKTPGSSAGAGTTPNAPSAPSAPTVSAPTTPNVSLFGQANQLNNLTSSQPIQGQQQQVITVKAIVSETDITQTQNKIKQIQSNSELAG